MSAQRNITVTKLAASEADYLGFTYEVTIAKTDRPGHDSILLTDDEADILYRRLGGLIGLVGLPPKGGKR